MVGLSIVSVTVISFSWLSCHQIQKLEGALRKQATALVYNTKQQRQLQEEIRWSQVEYSFVFSVNNSLHLHQFALTLGQ